MARDPLYVETTTTLPVDFHSTRRAYNTALARANVNVQTAMILAGHTDPKVHQRYVDQTIGRAIPEAALPHLALERTRDETETLSHRSRESDRPPKFPWIPERDTRFELATPSLGSSCSTN